MNHPTRYPTTTTWMWQGLLIGLAFVAGRMMGRIETNYDEDEI